MPTYVPPVRRPGGTGSGGGSCGPAGTRWNGTMHGKARRDVRTMNRLAWAPHRNGNLRAAYRLMRKFLSTGTRDPLIRDHAERILAAS